MTLETTPVQLLSDHSQVQLTSLGMKQYSLTLSTSELVCAWSLLSYSYIILVYKQAHVTVLCYCNIVSAPPVNVVATQSSSSGPVEVSWSPPSDGVNIITGYRIYYGNGKNVFVSSVTVITSVSLKVDRNYIGLNVSIRSESDQLYSELLNVYVTMGKYLNKN